MKRISFYLLLLALVTSLTGCNGGSSSDSNTTGTGNTTARTTGDVIVRFDLAALQQNPAAAAQLSSALTSSLTTTITSVTVTFSRTSFSDVVSNLNVVNNVASGTITGLEQGYWHIAADVYDGQTLIYTGSTDVNVIAGALVAAEILFDPVSAPTTTTTGSVAVTVGLNKYPGYSKIQQYVSTIFQDTVNQKFYIIDNSTGVLAVYNADTLVREKDITLQAAPQAAAVDAAGGSVLLGYSTGKLYRLNISNESMTLLADALISINAVVPLSANFALVGNGSAWGPSNTYVTINLGNGQIVSSKSYWYPLSNFVYNQSTGMSYALDSGLSPADMHHLVISASTGSIDTISDSRYHGDYSFGAPLRIINHGSRIATGSGNMFISTSSITDDITYAGNLGHTVIDLVSDDDLGKLYLLNSDNIQKLLVIDQTSLFTDMSIDLIANPRKVFNTTNNIVVFLQPDTNYYVKVFSKTSLGLL